MRNFARLIVAGIAGRDRNAELGHQRLGGVLEPQRAHRRRRRPDEDDPGLAAQLGEIGVLGQEAVARMDAFGADPLRQRDDRLAVEIALGAGADLVRLVGDARVQGAAVGRRRQRDRAHAHPPRRADDPAGDLAAIGDQDVGEHGGGPDTGVMAGLVPAIHGLPTWYRSRSMSAGTVQVPSTGCSDADGRGKPGHDAGRADGGGARARATTSWRHG